MFSYEELFQRNIGIFTPEEQDLIRNLKIAIAGVGGLGGSVAYSLARLGVGELRLADPEKFEVSNINRQFGAYVDTVGMYKSDAIANELLRINPNLIIKKWNEPLNQSNIPSFLDGVNAIVDGIEFFEFKNELALHKEAVRLGLWVFMLQGVSNITSFLTFDPNGSTFEDIFFKNSRVDLLAAIAKMFPKLPVGATQDAIASVLASFEVGNEIHFPSYSVLAPMGGVFVVEEIIKVIVRKMPPAEVAPSLFLLDLSDMTISHHKHED